MRQVELGSTGIQVSEFFFGAASIGGIGSAASTRGRGMETDEALERLDEAYELGIRVLDTANSYAGGESEKVVGRWREEREREDVLVATKVGNVVEPGQDGIVLKADHIARQLAISRSRLGHVDLYLSHAPDDSTPLEQTLEAFALAADNGTITAFGCSNVDVRRLEALLNAADRAGLPRPGWVQNEFSLLTRADEQDLFPLAVGERIGYTAYSPLAGGILSDRYLGGAEPAEGSRLEIAPAMYADSFTDENLARVELLGDIARERETSISGLALAWLRHHPAVTAPIVSPRREYQWDAVRQALEIEMDDELAERIGALFPAAGSAA
jgi:aryl-alcohol dehydrogenase-like predicted oxidoreductase